MLVVIAQKGIVGEDETKTSTIQNAEFRFSGSKGRFETGWNAGRPKMGTIGNTG